MGIRIQDKGEVVKGVPVVQPGDDLSWFNRPCFILYLINFVIFQKKNIVYSHVGLSYETAVEGHHWRIITSAFSHISVLHLVFNMSALWSLGVVEHLKQSGTYDFNFLEIESVTDPSLPSVRFLGTLQMSAVPAGGVEIVCLISLSLQEQSSRGGSISLCLTSYILTHAAPQVMVVVAALQI
ncbi:hypothetical protein Tsubulata_042969 [Turnera subulata]|uniref:Peptidase S54 rhomboid domain-containing protein n=1 Tax=Turnera subulata TaxID=218843 RepID=A0A9Q0JCW2_9ROSI|nr:hypothetical protein Tsubulata_042969 [Turnera subulata]